jgi:pyridoxal phosphate enzyme (YggS family)
MNANIKTVMSIADNIAITEERILKACSTAGRKRETITLMGVSKFHPIELVEEARLAGICCFGESRVQEGARKFENYKMEHPGIQVHFVGSLQRNKAKTAASFFDCIQSVDREALIIELGKIADSSASEHGRGKPLSVMLELHTGEESKSGFKSFDELFRAAEMVLGFNGLCPRGLMTMAPFTKDSETIRGSFRLLAKAQDELAKRFPPAENWACLSMGMSNDFEIAIEEGATLLRIGSLIFGERQQ